MLRLIVDLAKQAQIGADLVQQCHGKDRTSNFNRIRLVAFTSLREMVDPNTTDVAVALNIGWILVCTFLLLLLLLGLTLFEIGLIR